jgi:hypothetical protein
MLILWWNLCTRRLYKIVLHGHLWFSLYYLYSFLFELSSLAVYILVVTLLLYSNYLYRWGPCFQIPVQHWSAVDNNVLRTRNGRDAHKDINLRFMGLRCLQILRTLLLILASASSCTCVLRPSTWTTWWSVQRADLTLATSPRYRKT